MLERSTKTPYYCGAGYVVLAFAMTPKRLHCVEDCVHLRQYGSIVGVFSGVGRVGHVACRNLAAALYVIYCIIVIF